MVARPGIVAREYLLGARKKYFPPLNFFLIVVGILVFMTNIFNAKDDTMANNLEARAMQIKNPVQRQYVLGVVSRIRKTNNYTNKYSNIISMSATPLISIFFWLFYYRGRFNYTEHLVANMYFVGFVMLIYGLIFVPLIKINTSTSMVYMLLGLFFLFEIVYRSVAYYQFMQKKGAWAIVKAALVSLLVVVFWAGATMAAISYYISHGS
jgi:hypothetical protein